MKAVSYNRVSTREQADHGISLEAMKHKIRLYCELHDIKIIKAIVDAGKSGKDLNRDGVQELIGLVESGAIDAVVVYKLDRLSRRTRDVLDLVEIFQANGVAFHSIVEKFDTMSAMGRFVLTIMAALAQMEREMVSERTKLSMQAKKRNGERVGTTPFGFKNGGGDLVENVGEQAVIRVIVEMRMRVKRVSYRGIATYLNMRGYKTKKGGQWFAGTVRGIYNRHKK